MHQGIAMERLSWKHMDMAFRLNEETIVNGSERLKHAERREMGCVVMRGPRAMSGITSERAPSPTKQSTLTSSPRPPSLRLSLPFISICNKSRKSLEKATPRRVSGEGPATEEQKLCKRLRPARALADPDGRRGRTLHTPNERLIPILGNDSVK